MIEVRADYSGIDVLLKEAEEELYQEAITILTEIGELYVAEARNKGSFTDQTGNLRNAHSYVVYKGGVQVAGRIGRPDTLELFEKAKVNEGIQLIVGDGMMYASFVEGKGFDVTASGFLMVEREVRKLFR